MAWNLQTQLGRHFWIIFQTFMAVINIVDADNFDNSRQGGDKAVPTPMGSAIWWMLINASTLPNYGWTNTSNHTITPSPQINVTATSQFWTVTNVTAPIRTSTETGTPLPSSDISGTGTFGVWPVTAVAQVDSNPAWSGYTTPMQNPISTAADIHTQTATVISTSAKSLFMAPTLSPVFMPTYTWDPVTYTSYPGAQSFSTSARSTSVINATIVPSVPTREPRGSPSDQLPSSCRRYDDSELYTRLKDRGAYNQYFMANNPDEVGNLPGFKLSDDPSEVGDKFSNTFRRVQRSPTVEIVGKQLCTGRCKKISRIVQSAIEDSDIPMTATIEKSLARDAYDNSWNNRTDHNIDTPTTATSTSNGTNSTGRPAQKYGLIGGLCRLEHFIPIGKCDERGSDETDLARLCTSCRGVYKLPRGCFPQFLNAITCNNTDIQCIFDRWSKTAHGMCREETLTFTVMHNLGRDECQEWRFESVEVPIACQCYLSRSSWLEP